MKTACILFFLSVVTLCNCSSQSDLLEQGELESCEILKVGSVSNGSDGIAKRQIDSIRKENGFFTPFGFSSKCPDKPLTKEEKEFYRKAFQEIAILMKKDSVKNK